MTILAVSILLGCQVNEKQGAESEEMKADAVPEILPFKEVSLDDLSTFQNPTKNWQIAGDATCDLNQRHNLSIQPGTGVLANMVQEDANGNLMTQLEHGDLELHIEVMMPKGSNSGIYLQGRYEVQLFDSWMKDPVSFSDMGGIYQRWDPSRADGQQGFEGFKPKVNAAKCPGLWQHFHVLFRAPRFNASGKKVKDARFEFVDLNGFRIHENVTLSGPTRAASFDDESALGPLMLQGDHGPVAFRNIQYKMYATDTLELTDLTYALYHGEWDYIPDWDTLTPVKSGSASRFDPKEVTDQADHYGVVYTGKLQVKKGGDYLFETSIDDGGNLMIDSSLVVANEGEPGSGTERGIVHLEAGVHDLQLSFYQEVWSATIQIYYEGPQISRRSLASNVTIPEWVKADRAKPPITVKPDGRPELIRGFVDHGSIKTTHSISVGDPAGVHFSYNLANGALIKSWRGQFADVTAMWRNRGATQLTEPMNAATEFSNGISLAQLSSEQVSWPQYRPEAFDYRGYELDQEGRPHFQYVLGTVFIDDLIRPTKEGRLQRIIKLQGDAAGSVWHRIGVADRIAKLDNGLYSIGGAYYVDTDSNVRTRKIEGGEELVAQVAESTDPKIEYEIIW